jgi:hypothetical protein
VSRAARSAASVAAAILLMLARPALASPASGASGKAAPPGLINLPETPAQLQLGPAWSSAALPQLPASSDVIGPARLVALYREAEGTRGGPLSLVIVRFDAPNPRAWRAGQREAYFDEVEASVLAVCAAGAEASRGCKNQRQKRAALELEAVPGMDLQVRGGDGATRLFRFLFFRTYAIVAAVEVPAVAAGSRRAARPSTAALGRARKALAGFTVEAGWQR